MKNLRQSLGNLLDEDSSLSDFEPSLGSKHSEKHL
jgi:hypothetical protein